MFSSTLKIFDSFIKELTLLSKILVMHVKAKRKTKKNAFHPLNFFLSFLQNEVNAIKWDPQGQLLASCSDDMTLKVGKRA